jgi:hypothetical protein
MDTIYIALALLLSLATAGLAWGCQRLQKGGQS